MITISVSPSYSTTFQGKSLESDSVKIMFGKDRIDYYGNKTPTLEKVELKSNGSSILVENPILRMMGDSFVIKSFEDSTIIYGFSQGSTFVLHTLIFADGNIIRFSDNVEFPTPEITQKVIPEETSPKINNLNMLVQNPQFTYNAEEFNFDIKTFDKSKYSGNDFQNFFGKVDGVKIVAITKSPEGKILNTQTGVTQYGIYNGKVYVPENLWSKGWYTLEISASGDIGESQKTIEFYVAGQTTPNGGKTCPPGQTLVNGICV